MAKQKRPDQRSRKKGSSVGWATAGVALVVFGGLVALVLLLSFAVLGMRGIQTLRTTVEAFTNELPSPDAAVEREVFRSTLIYDRNGELLYEVFDPNGGRRTLVPLTEIPPYLVAATIATEDHEFYTNPGFDLRGIARAVWLNLRGQEIVSGGSTITQQLVRNTLFGPKERVEQSARRKLKEIILAYRLSQKYSKDEILERYLNEIGYGNLAYGVEAAAQTYFGKPVRELTLAESTLLAGLPQSPSLYDPYTNPKAAKGRQRDVLNLMVKHGYLTPDQADATYREALRLTRSNRDLQAPHFVLDVREQIERKYGRQALFFGGLRVYTTLDMRLQRQAEQIAREHVDRLKDQDATNAAVVGIRPQTGEILVMVGSADFWSDEIAGQINMATAERQPGSTLKPFTYASAFAKGLAAPASIILDEPVSFGGARGSSVYRPQNPDGKFRGPVTVRRALANSLNIPALKMLEKVGVRSLLDLLHRAGVTSLNDPSRYGLTLTLGGGEVKLVDLVFAYSVLANGGLQVGQPVAEPMPGYREVEPVSILKVVDDAGTVHFEHKPSEAREILSPQVAWLVTDILSDAEARTEVYGPDPFKIGRSVAVKTGTTDNYEDSWTVGYTPEFVVGVWVGNADHRPMKRVLGVSGAGAIWRTFMERALADVPPSSFDQPPGLVRVAVDPASGLLPLAGQPSITDWFIDSTQPTQSVATPTPTSTNTPLPSPTPTRTPTPTPTPPFTPTPKATSTPGEFVTMPSLVGLTESEARRRVDQLGLSNTYPNYQGRADVADKPFFDSIATGHVLSHQPAPGMAVKRGTTVYLAVRRE